MGRIEARMKRLGRLPVTPTYLPVGKPFTAKEQQPAGGGGKDGEEGEL